MTIKEKILEIRSFMLENKEEFESYLKSKELLEEKWEVFVKAPIEMSNFMPVVPKDLPFDIDFENFCENRYNTINMLDIMERVKNNPELVSTDLARKFKIYENNLKSLLMTRNIKEFRYDWLGEE